MTSHKCAACLIIGVDKIKRASFMRIKFQILLLFETSYKWFLIIGVDKIKRVNCITAGLVSYS